MSPGADPRTSGLGYFGIGFGGAEVGGSGGVSGVRLQAYARTSIPDRPYGVFNDHVASALGRAAGVPVPPGALVNLGGDIYGYVSMGFSDRGDRLPPVLPGRLARDRPWEATGIIVFDHWVLNTDRHDENLAYLPRLGVAAFDHDLAILGRIPTGEIFKVLEAFKDKPLIGHLLSPHLESLEYLTQWCDRVSAITTIEIRRIVNDCVEASLVDQALAECVVSFLDYRKSRLKSYVEATLDEYTSLVGQTLDSGEANGGN